MNGLISIISRQFVERKYVFERSRHVFLVLKDIDYRDLFHNVTDVIDGKLRVLSN